MCLLVGDGPAVTNMKGSVVEAMSSAIEQADVMLFAVSLAYKESANVSPFKS